MSTDKQDPVAPEEQLEQKWKFSYVKARWSW